MKVQRDARLALVCRSNIICQVVVFGDIVVVAVVYVDLRYISFVYALLSCFKRVGHNSIWLDGICVCLNNKRFKESQYLIMGLA